MKLWRVLVSTACYSLSLQFLGQIRRFSASALISASHFTGWSAIPWQSKLVSPTPHYTVLVPIILYCPHYIVLAAQAGNSNLAEYLTNGVMSA